MTAIPFSQFRADYLHVLSGPRYSVATMKKMRQVLRQVAALGVETTDQLTTALATTYASSRINRVCANTVRGELTYLRAACNYAIEIECLERGPKWRRIWPRRSPRARKTLHSLADLARVLEHLRAGADTWDGHRLLVAFALGGCAGLRRDELLRLRWEDIDLAAGILGVVPRRRLKTEGSERFVPICRELALILRGWRWRAQSPWVVPAHDRARPWLSGGKGGKPTQRLVEAGKAAGVMGLTFQSLRHSFATWGRRRWGISGPAMRDILGHTLILTHEVNYLHSPADLAELLSAVANVRYGKV